MTPCYYCELDRDEWCKRCLHDDKGFTNVDELLAALKRAMPALETIERRAQHGSPDGWKEAKADVIAAQSAIAKAEGKQ